MNRSHAAFHLLVAMIGTAALVFSVQTILQYVHYYRLDSIAPLKALNITPQALAHDQYVLFARYSYLDYEAAEVLEDTHFKNDYAAKDAAREKMDHLRKVWYSAKNPTYSSLERRISYKQMAYTCILWALVAYFIWLSKYAKCD